ncbi:MAG: thioredoxin domain-containing protein [Bacteroidales bacterium]|nr:thioredoxin domain-containing protein [Bacteroidales bacterium]
MKTPNLLINESSPYLLQHAYNPVQWHAWNSDTLSKAQSQNKPLLISIGYSTCHWCHVMEKESFEDEKVADLMNEYFICIKVDREERPEIDQIYMDAIQMLTGAGGWPLNCFALPDGRPFFGGTYFQKGQWTDIVQRVGELHRTDPGELSRYAAEVMQGLSATANFGQKANAFRKEDVAMVTQ